MHLYILWNNKLLFLYTNIEVYNTCLKNSQCFLYPYTMNKDANNAVGSVIKLI